MRRITSLFISVFVVALGAGVVAGMLASRRIELPGKAAPASESSESSWLADKLQLSADQRDQMRGIWEGVRDSSRNGSDDVATLQKQRDQAVFSLLTDEQKLKYNQLNEDYKQKFDKITADRQAALNQAVSSTMTILSTQQQQQYQKILHERVGRGPGHDAWPLSATTQNSP